MPAGANIDARNPENIETKSRTIEFTMVFDASIEIEEFNDGTTLNNEEIKKLIQDTFLKNNVFGKTVTIDNIEFFEE